MLCCCAVGQLKYQYCFVSPGTPLVASHAVTQNGSSQRRCCSTDVTEWLGKFPRRWWGLSTPCRTKTRRQCAAAGENLEAGPPSLLPPSQCRQLPPPLQCSPIIVRLASPPACRFTGPFEFTIPVTLTTETENAFKLLTLKTPPQQTRPLQESRQQPPAAAPPPQEPYRQSGDKTAG